MNVRIVRKGGIAGGQEVLAAVDTGKPARAPAKAIERGIAELSAAVAATPEPIGADMQRYELEISDGEQTERRFTVYDDGDPENVAMKKLDALLGLLRG